MSARDQLRPILDAALAAVDPAAAVRRALHLEGDALRIADGEPYDLAAGRLWVVGAGKAALGMARGALDALDGRVAGGSLTVPRAGGEVALGPLELWEGGHPLPRGGGIAGAADALRTARGARAGDLVLCLLSGGASALWSAPPDGVGLEELRETTAALLRAGVPIGEVNTVRRHLSRLAGGQLGRAAAPARVVTLIVSDVVGGRVEAIGSGPTAPDPTTYADALRVVRDRGVEVPAPVLRHLQAGAAGHAPETAKPGELEGRGEWHVVAWLRDALAAAAEEATRRGYPATVVSDTLEGEARGAGTEIALAALRARSHGPRPCALLWGGETTVTVRGSGAGGRCQEMALAAALALQGSDGVAVACMGTDGIDGPTPAAGALVDGGTAARARAAGLDPGIALRENDSHRLLAAAQDLLVTGPTGTNVGDLALAVVDGE